MSIWRNLNIPEVVKCSTRINYLKEQLDCTKIPRCFQTNLITHYKKIQYIKSNLEKTNIDNSAEFMEMKSKYLEYTTLYTDASDPQNVGNMGLGIYCPDRNIKLSGSLLGNSSICTSEVVAIIIAVNVIKEENIKKSIIFTDSLSA
ncbi:hypothetical protein WA026_019854 [Henosepilachna vigintioctopunctata]|uniref:RNase H type-1 domain-containing protein n=1 Tax=Henosepilachna vigintioctopunctata TaxID=420089 RepID=A0AAW1VFU4_9CUCU